MNPKFFKDQAAFKKWLSANHDQKNELLVGFYKVGSGKPSITWPQSVDEALSYGWIDGVRKSIDTDSYSIRFTPRKANSIWSAVNIRKAEALINEGLMHTKGLSAFNLRTEEKSRIYSFEKEAMEFSTAFEEEFKRDKKAWDFFIVQAPWYKKTIIHWVMTAK